MNKCCELSIGIDLVSLPFISSSHCYECGKVTTPYWYKKEKELKEKLKT